VALELPSYQRKENWGASETFYQMVRALAAPHAPAPGTPKAERAAGARPELAGLAALAILGIGTAWVASADDATKASDAYKKATDSFNIGSGGHPWDPKPVSPDDYKTLKHDHPTRGDSSALADLKKRLAIAAQIEAKNKADAAAAAKASADALAKSKAAAAIAAAQQKALNLLKALGITPITAEQNTLNEMEAARLNLVKQGNLAELDKLAALQKNIDLQAALNATSQRYADILAAINSSGGTLSFSGMLRRLRV
jgi:predicted Fe-Mo cluster-binding NifX family protein